MPLGWPPGTYEFVAGAFYVPYKGSQGGPFKEPKEAFAWMKSVDQNLANGAANDKERDAQVFNGMFPAVNFMHGPGEGREAAFIYSANRLLQEGKGSQAGNLYWDFGLFSGGRAAINGLINYGEQEQIYEHRSFAETYAAFPDTPVKQAIQAVLDKAK
jgi:hypothetical protein